MSVAVILGSAFDQPVLDGEALVPETIETPFGLATLHRVESQGDDAWVLFRHGLPHRFLPNQIPYRAHARALAEVGCQALLVTSSVGVLVDQLPLFEPLWVSDLLFVDNRLPDGSACTIFETPIAGQGHLVVEGGLLNAALIDQVGNLAKDLEWAVSHRATFAYTPGPRTKTAAENRFWRAAGAQVNSMTVAPEVVLANELEIPTAALVVGHKYSIPDLDQSLDQPSLEVTLQKSVAALERLVGRFLRDGQAVPFANQVFRF